MKFNNIALYMVLIALLAIGQNAYSQDETVLNEDKPFAKAHIILQLSDADPEKQATVLDIANNLTKHYGGPDMADIEIIAFGAGIDLLLEGNANEQRIASLADNGIKFYICMKTVLTRERRTGKRPKLSQHAIGVQTGVAFMVDEIHRGYTLVRP